MGLCANCISLAKTKEREPKKCAWCGKNNEYNPHIADDEDGIYCGSIDSSNEWIIEYAFVILLYYLGD